MANPYVEFELKEKMHYECWLIAQREVEAELQKALKEKEEDIKKAEAEEKAKADAQYEAAVQRLMEEIKNGHKPGPNT